MPRVFVSIGSNIAREQNIRGAVRALTQLYGPLTLSGVYETEAVGFAGDRFYNVVAAFDSGAPVEAIHEELVRIENAHGRRRGDAPRFAARTLDLDLLLYGDLIRHDGDIDVPRREIGEHAYVLGPLAEIAPELRHPETGETMERMWKNFAGRRELRPVDLAFD